MSPKTIDRGDGTPLAYELTAGNAPTLVFLPGFMSNMTGDKATGIAALCEEQGQGCLRLDYSGHGASGGRFEDGTIGEWASDALFLIDHVTEGPLVLVGSSMGGWIALLVALARRDRVVGLVGIAAGPDFTASIGDRLAAPQRATLARDGILRIESGYGGEFVITQRLIDEGASHFLLDAPIPLTCPVHLLQGQRDDDVPWQTALRIAERLESEDVRVTLIKDGEHRLSRPQDVSLLLETVGRFLGKDAG